MTARRRNVRKDPTTEAAFQDEVIGLARFYGWRSYHTHDSRRSAPGFPDLVLVKPPRLIFAELKTDSGRVRPEQREWLDDLGQLAEAEVYLWRRAQLQEIVEILAGDDGNRDAGMAWAADRRPQAVTPLVRHDNTLGGRAA